MMHDKWRSLFGTGCLMAVLVLFGASAAFAQTPAHDPTVLMGTAADHDKVVLQWTAAGTPIVADADATPPVAAQTMYEIAYAMLPTATNFGGVAVEKMKVAIGPPNSVTITGLEAGKRYVFGIRGDVAAATMTDWGSTATDEAADAVIRLVAVMTGDPPRPGDVDHRDVMITPGDKMLMVEWEDPLPGDAKFDLEIEKYMVQFSMKEKTGYKDWVHMPTEPMVSITGLDNGTMYYVRIKAVNDAGGESADWSIPKMGTPSADAPMPTPALPLFGAFALGAGLLAAGRARLRRREQRQLTR